VDGEGVVVAVRESRGMGRGPNLARAGSVSLRPFLLFISFFLFYLLISGFIQIFCKFDSIQIKQIPKIF
jgi:hypothetical protein